MHRRLHPRRHHFRYSVFWLLLDLDELDNLSAALRWFSHNRPNVFSFRDVDHGDGTATPLRLQIIRQLNEAGVDLAGGRISLLCMPRVLGYCFNPLSVFFCHRADGALAAVIYQVHNTFAERHSYVIPVENRSAALHQQCRKQFYVSPFMDMDMRYDFRITGPDARMVIGICATCSRGPVLSAVLTGARRSLTDHNLARVFLQVPVVTIKVVLAIRWEALRLWAKRIGLRRRPGPSPRAATVVPASARSSE
jgi:DUF1365 family protein